MTRSGASWALFIATRVVGLALDSAVLAASYWSAVALRFDFHPPRWGWRGVAVAFAVVAFVHLVSLVACGMPPEEFDVAASPRRGLEEVATWHS